MLVVKELLYIMLIAMVPVIELRGAIPVGLAMGLDFWPVFIAALMGNILPVPFLYLFARKFLVWGVDKPYVGKACRFFLVKGHNAGERLARRAGRGSLFFALLLFVGIPLPGTGAWTGTLGASFLDMGVKSTAVAVSLGVIIAGCIMALTSAGVFSIIGL